MYNSLIMANRVKALANSKNISIKALMSKCGLGENALQQAAKTENGMKAKNLYLIAEVLDCSVDYLLGRADKPNPEIKEVKDTNNTGGVHVFDLTVPVMNYPTTNEQQQEIAEMLSEMTPRQKNQLMTIIYDFYDECKKQSHIE